MRELTDLQTKVFNEAKRRMQDKLWFSGVCMDNFPSHADIERDGFLASVDAVVMETEMWDAC